MKPMQMLPSCFVGTLMLTSCIHETFLNYACQRMIWLCFPLHLLPCSKDLNYLQLLKNLSSVSNDLDSQKGLIIQENGYLTHHWHHSSLALPEPFVERSQHQQQTFNSFEELPKNEGSFFPLSNWRRQ
jgi:hypothetical protein